MYGRFTFVVIFLLFLLGTSWALPIDISVDDQIVEQQIVPTDYGGPPDGSFNVEKDVYLFSKFDQYLSGSGVFIANKANFLADERVIVLVGQFVFYSGVIKEAITLVDKNKSSGQIAILWSICMPGTA